MDHTKEIVGVLYPFRSSYGILIRSCHGQNGAEQIDSILYWYSLSFINSLSFILISLFHRWFSFFTYSLSFTYSPFSSKQTRLTAAVYAVGWCIRPDCCLNPRVFELWRMQLWPSKQARKPVSAVFLCAPLKHHVALATHNNWRPENAKHIWAKVYNEFVSSTWGNRWRTKEQSMSLVSLIPVHILRNLQLTIRRSPDPTFHNFWASKSGE